MLNSVNTNAGALVALQYLNKTNSELATTQARINTGMKVATAKDNAAVWAIAQSQRAESNALNAVKSSLQRGQSVASVALAAGEAISDILSQMKEKALASMEAGITQETKDSLNDEYVALRAQIDTIANNATFDGTNLIADATDADNGTDTVAALANAKGTATINIAHYDLSVNNAVIGATLATISGAVVQADIDAIDDAIKEVSTSLSKIGVGARSLDTHLSFVSKQQDAIDTGVGNLVDADLAKESARLQALQTKQQLGIQALSIANQSSSILLGLFR